MVASSNNSENSNQLEPVVVDSTNSKLSGNIAPRDLNRLSSQQESPPMSGGANLDKTTQNQERVLGVQTFVPNTEHTAYEAVRIKKPEFNANRDMTSRFKQKSLCQALSRVLGMKEPEEQN